MKKISSVFWISIAIVLATVIFGAVAPKSLEEATQNLQAFFTSAFGWYYLIIVTVIVLFCILLIFSPVGAIKLGKPDDKPEFSKRTWFAMLFSAGMGIGLVFWGAAEPLSHFMNPPLAESGTASAHKEAMRYTFFHWGIHAWAIYAIVALALAYFQFRKSESGLISATLKPVLGKRMNGPLGTIIDVFAVFATVMGVATTLGFGAIQINGGLSYLFNIPNNLLVQTLIVAVVTILFIISAWSGLGKGIKYLSNANMILAIALLLLMFIAGPTILILNMFTDSIGGYFQNIIQMSFRIAPLNPEHRSWIKVENLGKIDLTQFATEQVLFAVFSEFPLSTILSIVAIILVGTFFITSADSATFVLGMQTTRGSLTPPNTVKLSWGIAQSAVALILLYSGGLQALQNALISAAFPFSIIVILMMISLYRSLSREKRELGLYYKSHKKTP